MAAQVPNIFVEQYDQGQKKIRADLMDENFAYVCTQLDNNSDAGSAAQAAADAAQAAADAAQTTADGKTTAAQAAHAAMPSGQSVDLALPASGGTVTVPDDGYLLFMGNGVANQQSYAYLFGRLKIRTQWSGQGSYPIFLPVTKDEVVTVGYANLSSNSLAFIYANGSAPTN